MRYTQLTTALPTRTTLRKTARSLRRLATASKPTPITDYAASAAVLLVAVTTFVAGATAITVTVGVVLASLPAHPLALLVAAATTTVAFYTLPLLVVRAVTRAVVASE